MWKFTLQQEKTSLFSSISSNNPYLCIVHAIEIFFLYYNELCRLYQTMIVFLFRNVENIFKLNSFFKSNKHQERIFFLQCECFTIAKDLVAEKFYSHCFLCAAHDTYVCIFVRNEMLLLLSAPRRSCVYFAVYITIYNTPLLSFGIFVWHTPSLCLYIPLCTMYTALWERERAKKN